MVLMPPKNQLVTSAVIKRLSTMKLIDFLKTKIFFKLCVIYMRYLIGFAFVFASLVKIQGKRFTSIPPDQPIGYFFEAMYQTGFYWNFLGWCQFIAGTLLMTQRFSTVGAMMFFPIILNVFMITHSINFGMGTPLITTLMLLGTIFLLLWDYKKLTILFHHDHTIRLDLTTQPKDTFINHPGWTVTGIIFVLLTTILWLFQFKHVGLWMITMLAVGVCPFVFMMYKLRKEKTTPPLFQLPTEASQTNLAGKDQ
jgi:hypothetical protein